MTPKARRLTDLPHSRDYSEAAQVASNPQASPDERQDALKRTVKESAKYAQQFDHDAIMRAAATMAKAEPPQGPEKRGVAKISLDVTDDSHVLNLIRPVGLDFPQHREIVNQDPVLKSIIWTRIMQAQRFMRPSNQEWNPGFRFRFADESRDMRDEDRERFSWLNRWLLNCGAEFDPRVRKRMGRYNLRDFVAVHLQDSLTMDSAPIELVSTLEGRTHGFVPVDGGRVYLTDPVRGLPAGEGTPELYQRLGIDTPDPELVTAVLTNMGAVQAWYTDEDLLYPIRKPSSNMFRYGYGQPEPEDLIKIVTGFINAMQLNMRGFTHNSVPQGIMTVFGDFDSEDLEQFKSEWDSYVTGVSNAWRIPVLVSEEGQQSGATFVPTGKEFNEMYFAKWMTFLVAIKSALYGMDPTEINFESFTTKTSSLSGADTEERMASSQDKGLWPLLDYLQTTINEIAYTVDPEVELYWTGLQPDQLKSKEEETRAQLFAEYRQSHNLPPTGNEDLDNAPMDSALTGVYQVGLQNAAQKEMQEQQMQQAPQGEPTGEMEDVNEDGDLEAGVDTDGDGGTDAFSDTDAEGNRVMLDHEGNKYKVDPDDEPPMAKAALVEEVWP